MSDDDEIIFMGWMSLPFAAENFQEDPVTPKHTEDCVYSGQSKTCDGSCRQSTIAERARAMGIEPSSDEIDLITGKPLDFYE